MTTDSAGVDTPSVRYGLVVWVGDVACAARAPDGGSAEVPADAGTWWRDATGPARLAEVVGALAATYPGDELVALTVLAPSGVRRGLDGALSFAVPDVEVRVVPVDEALSETLGTPVRVAEWRGGAAHWSGTEGRDVALAPATAWPEGLRAEAPGTEEHTVEALVAACARTLELPVDDEPVPVDDDVQFTVYRPRAARPGRRERLLAFAHKTEDYEEEGRVVDPVEEVARQAEEVLGDLARTLTSSQDSEVPLVRGDTVRLEPVVAGLHFTPSAVEFRWLRGVHREVFEFTPPAHLDGSTLPGRLSVYVGLRLVADVPLRIRVATDGAGGAPDRSQARVYGKVFPSYSHQDAVVVEQVATAAATLGHEYLRDVERLRAGQDWQRELERCIDEADIFQLFWSPASMTSPHVRHEWEYALSLGRPDFVRPVFWQAPRASAPPSLPPPELDRLHFAFLGARQPPAPPAVAPPAVAPPGTPPRRHRGLRAALAGAGTTAVAVVAVTLAVTAGGGAPTASPPPPPAATATSEPADAEPLPTSAAPSALPPPGSADAVRTVETLFAALAQGDTAAATALLCLEEREVLVGVVEALSGVAWDVPRVVSDEVRGEARVLVVAARAGGEVAGRLRVTLLGGPVVCGLEPLSG